MTAAALMEDLALLGIRLKARGDRLRYSPRSAMTPDLAQRMKDHKGELLKILRPETDLFGDWIKVNEPDGRISWNNPAYIQEGLEVIDPPDPCPECGRLELWQSSSHHWRCLKCDPPHSLNRKRDPK